MNSQPSRNLALELARVTEAAALTAGRLMGRGDGIAIDAAAVDAMRHMMNSIQMSGVVVIGEGEKDEAPMLHRGEHVGNGESPEVDVAVDPVDGTRNLAKGRLESISAVALAPRDTMFNPGPIVYMNKIAVGPACRGAVDLHAPVAENLARIAKAKHMDVRDLTAVILDRPRHEQLIDDVRSAGARIRLIPACDVTAALMTAYEDSGIDVLLGIGGSPEGVLAACALRAMGGEFQGQLMPRNEEERQWAVEFDIDVTRILRMDDLVASDDVFFAATGISDGELLNGVEYRRDSARTDSLVVRGTTGTVRRIRAIHRLDKIRRLAGIDV